MLTYFPHITLSRQRSAKDDSSPFYMHLKKLLCFTDFELLSLMTWESASIILTIQILMSGSTESINRTAAVGVHRL